MRIIPLAVMLFCIHTLSAQSFPVTSTKGNIYPKDPGFGVGINCIGPEMKNLVCNFSVSYTKTDVNFAAFTLTVNSVSFGLGSDFKYYERPNTDITPQKKGILCSQLQLNGLDFDRSCNITYFFNGKQKGFRNITLSPGSTAPLSFTTTEAEELKSNASALTIAINFGQGVTWTNLSSYCGQVQRLAGNEENKTTQPAKQNNSANNNKPATTPTTSNTQKNTNTSSTTNNNNAGKTDLEKYNDHLKQVQQTTQAFDDASKKFSEMVNANSETAEQRKAKAEAKYQKEEAERIAKEEKEAKEERERNSRWAEKFKKDAAEYDRSVFKEKEDAYNSLFINNEPGPLFHAWIKACKTGTIESLTAFLKSNNSDYFKKVATEMIDAWKNGKSKPNSYIELAISENNWPLTKYLLDNGANPNYSNKNAFGNYYSAIRQFLDPYYPAEKELKYKGKDKIEFLKKMILQGADPNGAYEEKDNDGVICNDYLIRLILENDYKGELTKWLLDNNKLSSATIEIALAYLDKEFPSIRKKSLFSDYAQHCLSNLPEHFKKTADQKWIGGAETNGITLMDNLYIQATYLYAKKSYYEGGIAAIKYKNSSCYSPFYPTYNSMDYYMQNGGFWVYPNDMHLSYWTALQNTILSRVTEKDRWYLHWLAKGLIYYHDNKLFDSREMLAQLVRLGIKPNSDELDVGGKKKISMIDYAKDHYQKDLVSYLKDEKNFVNVKAPVITTTPAIDNSTPSTTSNASNIEFKKMWVDYDATNKGQKGMLMHFNFTISNMKGKKMALMIVFERKDGSKIVGGSPDYGSKLGKLAVAGQINPGYDVTVYDDVQLFMPYSEINIPKGKTYLKMLAKITSMESEVIQDLTEQEFWLAR